VTLVNRMPARAHAAVDALERIVGGFGTAILAIGALIWVAAVAVASLVGVGIPFLHSAARAVRAASERERARLSRWGPEIIEPEPLRPGPKAIKDVGRELVWVLIHSTYGMVVGVLGVSLPLYAVQDLTFPLWYPLVPPGEGPSIVFWYVDGFAGAMLIGLYGLFWALVSLFGLPVLSRTQAWPGRRLLAPPPGADLSLRVAQLTATRAAALDAHAAELRRIERSLHDGAQNRLVAVAMLLGAARRQVARDPAGSDELLGRAQDAAEQALAELRTVVRSILPPVLDGRGLDGALKAQAADCAVPCKLEVDLPVRCAASVEATAYFVVAEALTNVTRHSRASSASVTVTREKDRLKLRVEDDGRGGADESAGSGIIGIRRRVEAYDGTLSLTSPPGGPTTMWVELPCGS
jgi:signal transduction histidine kinase